MINEEKIPAPLRKELIEVFGEEKALDIIKKHKSGYVGIFWKIKNERFRQKYGFNLWSIAIILAIIYFVLSMSN